jgi:hypothetical protein
MERRRSDKTPNAIMKASVLGFTFGILVPLFIGAVEARDDGRYMQSPLKPWFDSLKSGKGPCCSVADGLAVADPDWESKNGHCRVRVDSEWIDVPGNAVITEAGRPNDGLAGQGVPRDFNSLLHAEQHDVIRDFGRLT